MGLTGIVLVIAVLLLVTIGILGYIIVSMDGSENEGDDSESRRE